MTFQLVKVIPVVNDIEQLGTKEKFWFYDQNGTDNSQLFKYSRENTGEHWSEKCAAEFCHRLHIPHASYDLAIYNDRLGVVTENIIPSGFRMVMGNEVLHSSTLGYPEPLGIDENPVRVREHTVTRVLGCLDKVSIQPPPTHYDLNGLNAADVFCGYLMLDALISNQDRHHENWAIMLNNDTGEQFLCPTYDHAASLGRELLDNERHERLTTKDKNRQIPFFVKKARSELFKIKTDKKTLSTVEAFQHAIEGRNSARDHWLGKLSSLTDESIADVFNQVPASCISDIARKFATLMVIENRRRLLE
ncbi:hypothetical protein [Proteus penneri]|uniref:HipA-like C-terminal domain-containing protein n=1 Tax=Proteus penneri TaxID=102862 RepID=A0A0G4QG87_9GAMM|nr:hypothetical protein [Proteus penneri]CRL64601.1 hypothetical protein BN1804_03089 [Proteus penneri]